MTPNSLDKIIGYVAPEAYARRVKARVAAERLAAYDGAKTGRRTDGWGTRGSSANAEIGGDLSRLRDRASDIVRNNHFGRNIQGKWRDAIVGPGILCRWEDPAIQKTWDAWSAQSSADGLPHFEAVQSLVCGSEWERGEVLIRKRPRPRTDGVWPPFQIQVLEADYLDTDKTQSTDTGYIIHGVEFDRVGRRTGYWLYGQHPGDVVTTGVRRGLGLQSAFVSASEVIHVYQATRPGQVRGVPRSSAVLMRMRDLDNWEDYELIRKQTEACLAGVVTSPEAEGFQFSAQVLDQNGNVVEKFEPGMMLKTQPGEDVKFNTPTYAGGYDEYKTSISRDIAAGCEMPFELMTGNYSKSNYSSSRMGIVAFQRTVEAMQWNVMIPLACEPVAAEFIRMMGLFDKPIANARHEWQPPKFNLLDRHAEAMADQLELQIGTAAWVDAVSRLGLDPVKQLAKIQLTVDQLKEAGVDFFGAKMTAALAAPTQGGQPA